MKEVSHGITRLYHSRLYNWIYTSGFLIRFLARTKLAQVKLLLSQCILTAPTMFNISSTIILLVLKSSTALTILAHVILLLHQCGPNLIMTLGHRHLPVPFGVPQDLIKNPDSQCVNGTVSRYGSHAITRYFTGCEIITELKVYVILQYLCKDGV